MSGSTSDQLALALGPYDNRKLFSDHFLSERLPAWPQFAAADSASLLRDLAELWDRERAALPAANEAQTEERLIKPVLARLGFAFTVQAGITTAAGHRQPDYALFVDDAARSAADARQSMDRYRQAVAVCDAKRFDRPLDRRRVRGALSEDPVAQIIHYIAVTRRRWGILTNGRLWRLYAAEGVWSRAPAWRSTCVRCSTPATSKRFAISPRSSASMPSCPGRMGTRCLTVRWPAAAPRRWRSATGCVRRSSQRYRSWPRACSVTTGERPKR